MKPANNAPVYAGMYAELATIARDHGYAMAVHGSMARDFDLICIPWTEDPSPIYEVVKDFSEHFHVLHVPVPTKKNNGRISYAINFSFADCYLDISFIPPDYALLREALDKEHSKSPPSSMVIKWQGMDLLLTRRQIEEAIFLGEQAEIENSKLKRKIYELERSIRELKEGKGKEDVLEN